MLKINIEPMTVSDLELISPILLTEFDDFWNISTFKSELENPNSQYFVAKSDNNIVGFAGIWQAVDEVHVTDIVVKKDFRKLGIGSILLEHLINTAHLIKDVTSVTLEVKESNIAARKLYQKYQFEELGIRKNYYGPDENAVIMTLYFNK